MLGCLGCVDLEAEHGNVSPLYPGQTLSGSHTVVGCNCLCCQTEREEEREEAGDVSPNLRKSPSPSLLFLDLSGRGTKRLSYSAYQAHTDNLSSLRGIDRLQITC